jgi:hypothetical protein
MVLPAQRLFSQEPESKGLLAGQKQESNGK